MTEKEISKSLVRIRRIRNRTDFAVTFTAVKLDVRHNVIDHSHYLVVSVPKYACNTVTFFPNEVWEFEGSLTTRIIHNTQYVGKEDVLEVTSAKLIRESGDNFVTELVKSGDYEGIGNTLATRLWETFGCSIYEILDNGEKDKLLPILRIEVAENLIHVWNTKALSRQIRWVELMGIPSRIGHGVVNYYREKTESKVNDNPYRLLPFSAKWDLVDELAQKKFEIAAEDPRRLYAALEHAVHLGVTRSRKGHSAFTMPQIRKMLSRVLNSNLANKALEEHRNKALVAVGNLLAPTGYFIQEKYLAVRIANSLKEKKQITFDQCFSERLNHFESTLAFPLTDEQKEAIEQAVESQVTILTGGAGCGKTTTLVGMIDMLEYAGYSVLQMALSGRAALRMTESSGKEAITIAAFRTHVIPETLPEKTCLVIDEASMVSLNDAFAILRRLPHKGKLILIGDPVQLPPIGAGLFFRPLAMMNETKSCRVELTEVKRQSESSGIPRVAASIRKHEWPTLEDYSKTKTGVSFLSANNITEMSDKTLKTFYELSTEGSDTRILTPLKETSSGVMSLNQRIQEKIRSSDEHCLLWNYEHDQPVTTGFKLNDKVVFLRNDYKRGLRNGSLGTVVKNYDPVKGEDNLMDVAFDEGLATLRRSDWDSVQLAYALTVHKSQGSQFDRVIIPVVDSVLTDQSLIYTALTRSVDQAVFIGDQSLAQRISEAPSSASLRQVGFETLLKAILADSESEAAQGR